MKLNYQKLIVFFLLMDFFLLFLRKGDCLSTPPHKKETQLLKVGSTVYNSSLQVLSFFICLLLELFQLSINLHAVSLLGKLLIPRENCIKINIFFYFINPSNTRLVVLMLTIVSAWHND